MRKALLPMLASFALCGAATAALVITTAHAQPERRKPMMVALASPGAEAAAPAGEGGAPRDHAREMGRGMHMPSPAEMAAHFKQMCQDRYAREAGGLAYTEAKLSLTGAQQPLFEHWKQAKLDIAKRQSEACAAREHPRQAKETKMPSLVDHMARREEMLKKRLADLEAERPALEAFYNSLSAGQKREFGRGAMEHGMMHEHHMFAGGPGMMGHRMGPNMMYRRQMGPDGPPPGPGDAPPGPPPQ